MDSDQISHRYYGFSSFITQLSAAKPSPFTRLPIELVRSIMGIAAAEGQRYAFSIALVSKDINRFVTPILYQTIILSVFFRTHSFWRTLGATGTAGAYVLNLLVEDDFLDPEIGIKILTACPRVERLVLHGITEPWDAADMHWPTPWEVSFTTPYAINEWFTHPIMRNVTHLLLNHLSYPDGATACLSLQRLTHLGFRYNREDVDDTLLSLSNQLLCTVGSLEMLLIHADGMSGIGSEFDAPVWAKVAKIEDERLFVRRALGFYELPNLLKSRMTIWDHARENFKDWRDEVPVEWEGWSYW